MKNVMLHVCRLDLIMEKSEVCTELPTGSVATITVMTDNDNTGHKCFNSINIELERIKSVSSHERWHRNTKACKTTFRRPRKSMENHSKKQQIKIGFQENNKNNVSITVSFICFDI